MVELAGVIIVEGKGTIAGRQASSLSLFRRSGDV
jgi:hypothetical protein